ncbi:hypothetical protein A3715_28795 [Oleiphilus sp. HI0009]|nr:hypothetical protein A3715_13900 [Oleiphilus sp. HI0009]KZX85156.1 hypothetical protein A3715_28795 [Oleiphilus sp. HI0009]KZY64611.1 hypothetical protein A3738_09975 [Oleiphilus sp. HI0066]
MSVNFDKYLAQINKEPSVVELIPDWMQGRAGFGGIVAALVFESMRKQLSQPVPVRCLQISFVGPVDSSPLEVSAEVLREGKSVSHVVGKGVQDGQVKVLIQGSFGASRESAIHVAAEPLVLTGGVDQTQKLSYIKDMIPEFTKHFDFRYLTKFPFAGSDETSLEGYVRFSEEPESVSEAHLLGLIDAWPPTTLPMMKKLCMASSLSWTVEFIQPYQAPRGDEYIGYKADIVDSQDGYAYARAKVANDKGELIAISQQTVTHFG